MKNKSNHKQVWVAIKVERGYISDARAYETFKSAKQTERRWRSRINPDYDETAVLKSKLIACRTSKKGQLADLPTSRKLRSKRLEKSPYGLTENEI
jgi:hypothetical protein